jgi:hypothetical protein
MTPWGRSLPLPSGQALLHRPLLPIRGCAMRGPKVGTGIASGQNERKASRLWHTLTRRAQINCISHADLEGAQCG